MKYNIISGVSQHVLAILVFVIVYKSTFSTKNHILNLFESFLSLSTIPALVCCQNLLHLTPIPIGTKAFINCIENHTMIELDNLYYKLNITYFILWFPKTCQIHEFVKFGESLQIENNCS